MKKIENNDTWMFDGFRIIEKSYDHPEKLTRAERKRLKEMGMAIDQNIK